jgi:hypothetical protein
MKILLSGAVLASTIVMSASAPSAADGTWGNPVDISPAAQNGFTPQISSSADGKNLTSVWISNDGLQSRALGALSTDHGTTWSQGVAINAPAGDSSAIRLAGSRDGRRAVSTFVDFQVPGQEIVRTATLTDGVWAQPVNVSVLASSSGSPSPAVAMSADGNRVTVVFAQLQGATHQIQSRTSTDSGATYSASVPLTADTTSPSSIDVVSSADGQRMVAVWKETISGVDAVRASFSANGGGTWSSPERLSALTRNSINPDLTASADGSTAVASWQEKVSDTERLIQTRTLTAGNWSPAVRLSPVGQSSTNPRVSSAADGSRATVVWANANAIQIQSAHGIGDSWNGPGSVSEAGTAASDPDVASSTDGLRVTAVWRKASNQVLSSESDDGGATWGVPVSVSASGNGTNDPRIASSASGFRFAAVWTRSEGAVSRIQAGTYFEVQSQAITLQQPSDLSVGSSTALAASSSSGLPVTLVSSTPGICSVSGSQLTALGAGTCSIVASQPGDIDFLPAADVSRSLTVFRGQQTITCAKTPPGKIKRRGTTVVLPKNCRTDAGQRVTVKVDGKRKDLRNVKVVKKAGKTTIRTFGTRVRLKLTYRAAGTGNVDPFGLVRRYRT